MSPYLLEYHRGQESDLTVAALRLAPAGQVPAGAVALHWHALALSRDFTHIRRPGQMWQREAGCLGTV